jgi:hypothetical protein
LYRIVFAAGSAATVTTGCRHIKNVAEPMVPRNLFKAERLTGVTVQQGRSRMNNPNEKPGQQNQSPGQQKPGQQQQGGGQPKPGQQQQDPGKGR